MVLAAAWPQLSQAADDWMNLATVSMTNATNLDIQAAAPSLRLYPTTQTNYAYLSFSNTGNNFNIGRDSSTGGSLLTGSTAYAAVLNSFGTAPMQFGVNGALAMTISATAGTVIVGPGKPRLGGAFAYGNCTGPSLHFKCP
jgi:hypothetical protein